MGANNGRPRMPFQKSWTTPVKPFDPNYFKKLDEKEKLKTKRPEPTVGRNPMGPSAIQSMKVKENPSRVQPVKWWQGTDIIKPKKDEDQKVDVIPAIHYTPLVPTDPLPPIGEPFPRGGIPAHYFCTLPGQILDEKELEEIAKKYIVKHVPTDPNTVPVITLPDFDENKRKMKLKNKLPPLKKTLKKTKSSKKHKKPVAPLDESLFVVPDPVIQDVEEKDVEFGHYENKCPTHGGMKFDLMFDNCKEEKQHCTSKPSLSHSTQEKAKRKRKVMKKELDKRIRAADKRRKVN